jgi:hypothetical protein
MPYSMYTVRIVTCYISTVIYYNVELNHMWNSNIEVETKTPHIIEFSLKMDYLVKPKTVRELTNKLIIQTNQLVLILCELYCRVGNINTCTGRDVRRLYKY